MAPRRRVKQLDGASLRALAHPLRSRLYRSLRVDGPGTATQLARRLGENSGATSYHLRVLAEHGFVEDDPDQEPVGRERWWRASHTGISWKSVEFQDDPDEREADAWLFGHHTRQTIEWIDGWAERRTKVDPEWLDATDQSDYNLRATPARMRALSADLHAVIQRHVEEADAEADAPEAADVRLLLWTLLREPAPPEPPDA